MFIVTSLLHGAYQSYERSTWAPDPEVYAGVIAKCNETVKEMLNFQISAELGFRSLYSVVPAERGVDSWVYHAQVSRVEGKPIGFFKCSADKAEVNEHGSLVEASELFVELYDYRGAKK